MALTLLAFSMQVIPMAFAADCSGLSANECASRAGCQVCPTHGGCISVQFCCYEPGVTKDCHGNCIPVSQVCCDSGTIECNGACIPDTAICLLAPPPGVGQYIDTNQGSTDPFQYWQSYFGIGAGENLWSWGLWMGAGLAVLNVVIAGFQIMGGETMGMVSDGKQRMMWSIVGLIMLLFAGVILNFLNPLFFQAG